MASFVGTIRRESAQTIGSAKGRMPQATLAFPLFDIATQHAVSRGRLNHASQWQNADTNLFAVNSEVVLSLSES